MVQEELAEDDLQKLFAPEVPPEPQTNIWGRELVKREAGEDLPDREPNSITHPKENQRIFRKQQPTSQKGTTMAARSGWSDERRKKFMATVAAKRGGESKTSRTPKTRVKQQEEPAAAESNLKTFGELVKCGCCGTVLLRDSEGVYRPLGTDELTRLLNSQDVA